MNRFKVVTVASLFSGVVKLDRNQAATREHALRHLQGDVYEILAPIQFKAGEVLGYDGGVNRSFLQLMTPVDEPVQEIPKIRRPGRPRK